MDENDELTAITLPKVRVALLAARTDLEKSIQASSDPKKGIKFISLPNQGKTPSLPQNFFKKCVADARKRIGRILKVLDLIAVDLS